MRAIPNNAINSDSTKRRSFIAPLCAARSYRLLKGLGLEVPDSVIANVAVYFCALRTDRGVLHGRVDLPSSGNTSALGRLA